MACGVRTPRQFDALGAAEAGWGRLVPSRNDGLARGGDEPSPPRFRGGGVFMRDAHSFPEVP